MFVVQDPKLCAAVTLHFRIKKKFRTSWECQFQPLTKEEVLTSTNIDGNTLDGLIELLDHEKQLMKIP